MRGTHTRKRSGGPLKRSNKRRRTFRRRKGKNVSFTSKAGVASNYRFRSKRLSSRSYRSRLWNDSIMKTHYRSNQSIGFTLSAPLSTASVSVGIQSAIASTAAPFWTSTGGAIQSDIGVAVPTFTGDITLRGGMIGLRISNNVLDSTPVEADVYLLYSANNPTLAGIAAQPLGFEPSQLVDFKSLYGKVIMRKKVLIENANSIEITHRLRVQKIDQNDWATNSKRFYWMIAYSAGETLAVASVGTAVAFWNLSFSADAV